MTGAVILVSLEHVRYACVPLAYLRKSDHTCGDFHRVGARRFRWRWRRGAAMAAVLRSASVASVATAYWVASL